MSRVDAPAFGPRPVIDVDLGPTEDPDEDWDVPDVDPIDRLTEDEERAA